MAKLPKSANSLGISIHKEFCDPPMAIMPVLKDLLGQDDMLIKAVADEWGIQSPQAASKSLNRLSEIRPTSIPHDDRWKFLLRAAQCAAVADQSIKANLVPMQNKDQDTSPRVVAVETIHELGQRSISLLCGAIDTDIANLASPDVSYTSLAKQRASELGMKPQTFRTVFTGFAANVAPGQLSLLRDKPLPESMHTIFRICSATAVVNHSLQIEFVPFITPAGL